MGRNRMLRVSALAQLQRDSARTYKRNANALRTSEANVMDACGDLLAVHPRVAWHRRMNVGAAKIDGRFIRFAFVGCSDYIGQMTDGRFLAIEVKKPGARTEAKRLKAQIDFLEMVAAHGGVAAMVASVETLETVLRNC